jgi:rhomboid family GlyGly-CTERM serine protease
MKRIPIWTLIAAAIALLIAVVESAGVRLVYDRAAILRGEVWRLLSGHFVHFSPSHLAVDIAALLFAGAVLERRTNASCAGMFVLMPIGISLVLVVFEPAMARYGGLSAMVTAFIVYLALELCRSGGTTERLAALAALMGVVVKVALDATIATPLFARLGASTIVSTASHAAGVVLAMVTFLMHSILRKNRHGFRAAPTVG